MKCPIYGALLLLGPIFLAGSTLFGTSDINLGEQVNGFWEAVSGDRQCSVYPAPSISTTSM